mmetsp:Transcript_4571/g.13823  ORF Transcript_4571/g.13823 Transcript_4571/m.13823 type:complete len:239 (-) Transcript_4571:983-1699(-)
MIEVATNRTGTNFEVGLVLNIDLHLCVPILTLERARVKLLAVCNHRDTSMRSQSIHPRIYANVCPERVALHTAQVVAHSVWSSDLNALAKTVSHCSSTTSLRYNNTLIFCKLGIAACFHHLKIINPHSQTCCRLKVGSEARGVPSINANTAEIPGFNSNQDTVSCIIVKPIKLQAHLCGAFQESRCIGDITASNLPHTDGRQQRGLIHWPRERDFNSSVNRYTPGSVFWLDIDNLQRV